MYSYRTPPSKLCIHIDLGFLHIAIAFLSEILVASCCYPLGKLCDFYRSPDIPIAFLPEISVARCGKPVAEFHDFYRCPDIPIVFLSEIPMLIWIKTYMSSGRISFHIKKIYLRCTCIDSQVVLQPSDKKNHSLKLITAVNAVYSYCLLYTSPSPRD